MSIFQQEENNNITSPASSSQLQGYYQQNSQLSLPNNGQQRLQQLLRSGTSAINNAVTNTINNGRYNIASANPLLAEKLSATSSAIKQEPISSDYNTSSMNYGNASPMQRMPSGKPQVHDAGGGKGTFYYLLVLSFVLVTSIGEYYKFYKAGMTASILNLVLLFATRCHYYKFWLQAVCELNSRCHYSVKCNCSLHHVGMHYPWCSFLLKITIHFRFPLEEVPTIFLSRIAAFTS